MRIAILGSVALPVPPPAQGGTEWIAYFQATGLSKRGHKVLLFAAHGSKTGDYELIEVGKGDTVAGSALNNQKTAQTSLNDKSLKPNLSDITIQKPAMQNFPVDTSQPNFFNPELIRKPDMISSNSGITQLSKQVVSDSSISKNINIESSRDLRKENIYLGEVIEQLIKRKDDYDIILNNMRGEAVLLPIAKMLNKPFVNVMHLPLFPELVEAFKTYNTHIITISNAQRRGFENLNYLATVNNCVDTDKYVLSNKTEIQNPESGIAFISKDSLSSTTTINSNVHISQQLISNNSDSEDDLSFSNPSNMGEEPIKANKDEGYLLMMGTIGRHKNQAGAISVAKKMGMKLVLAGKIRDQDYFEELEKDIDGTQIRWVGEITFEEKLKLYQNAKVFIFPILWEEPFGLVMIEAMACGTPVVAYNSGAISEVVVSGLNGFVVESGSENDMIKAVNNIGVINRAECRKYVIEHFSVEKMVADYEKALQSITQK